MCTQETNNEQERRRGQKSGAGSQLTACRRYEMRRVPGVKHRGEEVRSRGHGVSGRWTWNKNGSMQV